MCDYLLFKLMSREIEVLFWPQAAIIIIFLNYISIAGALKRNYMYIGYWFHTSSILSGNYGQ